MARAKKEEGTEKKKKGLGGILAVLVVGLGAGAGGYFYANSQQPEKAQEGSVEKEAVVTSPSAGLMNPPVFFELDTLAANLSQGEGRKRAIQAGIALRVTDEQTATSLKAFVPAIQNQVIMLLSMKTAEELATREGKESLAREIRDEVNRMIAGNPPPDLDGEPARIPEVVLKVMFRSLIVQ